MGSRVYHWLFCGCRALCSGLCALWPQGWLEKWTTHDIEGRPRPGQDTACKKFLRACGGFTLGLLLTALYAVIVLFVKCHNTQFCLWSTIVLGTFLTLGMAFSATVRTIVFLMLPQLCSGKGTTIMIFITMALAVQGPGANTMENVHRVSDSLSCGLELTLNHTKELIEEAKQPLLRAVRFLKSIGTKLFSVSERTRRFFSSMLNGVKHIGRSLRNVWEFLSNMGEVCNEELETPYTKCIGIFNRGKEQCFKSLSILGFLCYIVDAFRPLCGLAKSVTLLCAIPSYIQTFVRKHLQTPLVSVLRYTKDQFQFNLTVIHEFGVMVNASKSVMQVATDIMEEIQEYMEPYRKALSLFTYSMICVILYYFIMAMRYRYMYLHDDEFDNVYITQRFIRIDVIRERSNQPTLLPLSSTEACDYIRPGSLALTRHERKGYTFAIINVFRSLLIVSVFLLVDYVIFWLLDMTVYHLQADVVAQAPVLVTLTASGKGFFREIFSRVVDAFNVMQNTNFTIFSKKCLIRPSPPDVTMYFLIVSLLPRVLRKLKQKGGNLIVAALAWFSDLQDLSGNLPLQLRQDLLTQGSCLPRLSLLFLQSDWFELLQEVEVKFLTWKSSEWEADFGVYVLTTEVFYEFVLNALQESPFEPLESVDLKCLTLKVAFLLAIASARRVSDLGALSCHPLFLIYHCDRAILRTHPGYLPKVVSSFHLNQEIVVPAFISFGLSSNEKSLDVVRALRVYVERTASIKRSDSLVVLFGFHKRGWPANKQTLDR
ncbi:DC-STAMP domain-containing protein 2 [Pseudophryne corroboree]|uniref:DC-STAMP domain-containing protein 2 n=1 Tax=Pseudophryne corroboree TaxID=495146 RepID=UPI003081B2FD